MENYKIRVNNEAESKEAQELFFELGYKLDSFFAKYKADTKWVLACADGSMGCASEGMAKDTLKEITFPQLRDLVVLKRNDVNDANYRSKSVLDGFYFKSSDGVFYFMFEGKWVRSTTNTDEGLESITKDLGLISGAEALRALADGKEAEGFSEENEEWVPIVYFTVQEVVNGLYKFRLKPQTVKVELELPKPFEPEEDCHVYILDDGKTDGYRRYSYEVHGDKGNTFIGIWRTEEEIKQVVEQLRKIKGAV
ncbi:AB1gp47 [Acinetobacter phage AB1]|uniref:AB1gp47 n=1 Tax=Acinetobacter phage AB1 TaxID=889876 RepID=E2GLY5_9CAUD|nr:AB1gp47 [Acinetobacter phage AB1]ADO14418.1 AB1gp47 [Acinetobacter phage AB1]